MPTKSTIDSPIFRRRQRRKDHYHQLDKTIIFAYPNLSDGAKLTYIVLDSYDWDDGDGGSKGYVFPYQSTLARVRKVSERTIRNHLKELINARLITAEVVNTPKGRRNIYWIEDCSQEEFERYLESISKPQLGRGEENNFRMGEENNFRMGEENNFRHKDTKEKDTKKEGQDKTVKSGRVLSSVDEIATTFEESPTEEPPSEKDIQRVIDSLADELKRPPSRTEKEHLTRLIILYGVDDVELALGELTVQRDLQIIKNPLRYVEGTLKNWMREGRRVTDMLTHLRGMSMQRNH